MSRACRTVAVLVATLVVGMLPAQAAYLEGFTWDRSVDYDAGTVHGSTLGNPSTDAEGNGVWQMESTNGAGDGLIGPSPWYQGTTQVQVWDNSWYGGGGTWARGDNVNPPIGSTSLTHNIGGGTYANIPLIRWLNPVEQSFLLDISGILTEVWNGPGSNRDSNVDFDVVIAHMDVSTGLWTEVFAQLFEKPNDDNSIESLTVAVDLTPFWVDPGDEIVISHRGLRAANAWPQLQDHLVFELVNFPEPTTLTLLAFGGLGMLTRRRRRQRG